MLTTNTFHIATTTQNGISLKSLYYPSSFNQNSNDFGQDCVSFIPSRNSHKPLFACITDGVGGSFHGEIASEYINQTAFKMFLSNQGFRYLEPEYFPITPNIQKLIDEQYQAALDQEKLRKQKFIQQPGNQNKLFIEMESEIKDQRNCGSSTLVSSLSGNKECLYFSNLGNINLIIEGVQGLKMEEIYSPVHIQRTEDNLTVFEMEDTAQWSSNHGIVGAKGFNKIQIINSQRLIMFSDGITTDQAKFLLKNHYSLVNSKRWKDLAERFQKSMNHYDDISVIVIEWEQEGNGRS